MTKYIIDLPNSVSTLIGTTSIVFGGAKELLKIPVSMLEKYEDEPEAPKPEPDINNQRKTAKVRVYGAVYINEKGISRTPTTLLYENYWEDVTKNWYIDEETGLAFRGEYAEVLDGKLRHK